MPFSVFEHNSTVLAVQDSGPEFGWIVFGCLLLPVIIGLSRHALLGLCRAIGSHSLITISAVTLFATILATPLAIPPHVDKSPEPEQSEHADRLSAHELLGIPQPDGSPTIDNQRKRKSARVDPFGLALRGGRVWETIVGLVAWIPSCFIDGSNFREPRWPFVEPWSPLGRMGWWLIPPASLLCLLGILNTAVFLPPSLMEIRGWTATGTSEPPFSKRRPALVWLGALLVPVFLNDLGVVEFPGIVVTYLALACFASLFAFQEFASDKAWAIAAMISRQEAVARRDEQIHSAMEEGDFIEEVISLGEVESGPSGRVPESTLLFYAFIGGWPGALAAQGLLWHKVSERKEGFRQGLAVAVFLHCLVVAFLFWAMMGLYS
jgi:hypothetical protein